MNNPSETSGSAWRQIGCLGLAVLLMAGTMGLVAILGFEDNPWAVIGFTFVAGVAIVWIVARLFGSR